MVAYHGPRSESIEQLLNDCVPSRIANRDATLWGASAQPEASVRLGWVDAPTRSKDLHFPSPVDSVVLAGMSGSSLAPELFAKTYGKKLTVIDSVDPDQVRSAFSDPNALVIVSSKSGGTIETMSQRHYAENLDREIVVITDHGSALSQWAEDSNREIFYADPHVGWRFSAFTAFGLIPAAYLGIDVEAIIDEATPALELCLRDDADNPALALGALLADRALAGQDKVFIVNHNNLGDWIEQLLAESSGKNGRGILPIVVSTDDVVLSADDCYVIHCGQHVEGEISLTGTVPELMAMWEVATAIACRVLGVNPFDQPDVESAKKAARENLGRVIEPAFTDHTIEVYPSFDSTANNLHDVLSELFSQVHGTQYVAIQAFMDREAHASFASVRSELAAKLNRPVTFGWGPRYLHSTGQIHKGGPATGVFLHITVEPDSDLSVPNEPYSFGQLIQAQAIGDAQVLADHGLAVLRVHLRNQTVGLTYLRELLA